MRSQSTFCAQGTVGSLFSAGFSFHAPVLFYFRRCSFPAERLLVTCTDVGVLFLLCILIPEPRKSFWLGCRGSRSEVGRRGAGWHDRVCAVVWWVGSCDFGGLIVQHEMHAYARIMCQLSASARPKLIEPQATKTQFKKFNATGTPPADEQLSYDCIIFNFKSLSNLGFAWRVQLFSVRQGICLSLVLGLACSTKMRNETFRWGFLDAARPGLPVKAARCFLCQWFLSAVVK